MTDNYLKKRDEEIIALVHEGDKDALDYILEKYKNMVRKKAHKLFLIGADKDDLIQEGMIGLYKAVRDYNAEREGTFSTFANLCINGQMYDAIKASNRQKNLPLNTYISFYGPGFHEDVSSVFAEYKVNPESLMIDKENVNTIEQEIKQSLSAFEQQVITLYLEGQNYLEIAQLLNKPPKSVDNALQRIKTKLLKNQQISIDK